jgi:protein SCO1/2
MLLVPAILFLGLSYSGYSMPVKNRDVSESVFLVESTKQYEVIFFGYVGCSFICPTALFTLGDVLEEIRNEHPEIEIGGIFVDVNAETQIRRAHEYSQYFSSTITGVNVSKSELDRLRKQFGIQVYQTADPIDMIAHTDHFFLVEKDSQRWKINEVFANQTTKQVLKKSIVQKIIPPQE